MKFIFLSIVFWGSFLFLNAASINIYNDSPYILMAEVLSADGHSLGKLKIAPQHQQTWEDHSGGAPTWSQTPYTVIFTCPNGKQYGVSRNVQQGATITAQGATGDLYCEPQKGKENETKTDQSPRPLQTDSIWGPP